MWEVKDEKVYSGSVCTDVLLHNFPFPCTVRSYCTAKCCFWWQCLVYREDACGGMWQLHR